MWDLSNNMTIDLTFLLAKEITTSLFESNLTFKTAVSFCILYFLYQNDYLNVYVYI